MRTHQQISNISLLIKNISIWVEIIKFWVNFGCYIFFHIFAVKCNKMQYSDSFFKMTISDGIVCIKWLTDYVNDVNVVDNFIRKRIELQNNQIFPMLSDIRKLKGGNLAIRKRMVQPDGFEGINAIAVLCSSRFQVNMFNFFLLKYKLPMPYRCFIEEDDAIRWLTFFRDNPNKQPELEFVEYSDENFSMHLKNNILYVDWLKEKYDLDELDFIIKKKVELLNGAHYPVVTDFSKVRSGSRAAFRRMTQIDAFLGIKASATICNTNVQYVLFSSFRKICNPKVPNRFFTKRQKALEWAQNFV
jgi:hypothetical protein